jgi:Leucine-rich repeat (LRR) protein
MSGAQLNDATPLASLTKLTYLDLSGSPGLTNFGKLSALTNLTQLRAESCTLTSIPAVTGMTKLELLDLAFNQIVDVSPVQGLLQLHELFLNLNPVTDITPIVNNAGIAAGDAVYVNGSSMNCQDQAANVTALLNRQVTLFSPCN